MQEVKTLSFKDVHKEIELESDFLKKDHDLRSYSQKAGFLQACGFENSIATKMYSALANSGDIVQQYEHRYKGQYKFILEPQLERICEKYNLFVRETRHFIGDIPEGNIKEMMKFKVYISDILSSDDLYKHTRYNEVMSRPFATEPTVGIEQLRSRSSSGYVQIAAIKGLFAKEAFDKSDARIIRNERTEAIAKGQVDLDPIVLCKTIHGYLIITAWGDEANDELVINPKMN